MFDWLPHPFMIGLLVLGVLWPAWYFLSKLRKKETPDPLWLDVVAALTAMNASAVLIGELAGWIAD